MGEDSRFSRPDLTKLEDVESIHELDMLVSFVWRCLDSSQVVVCQRWRMVSDLYLFGGCLDRSSLG